MASVQLCALIFQRRHSKDRCASWAWLCSPSHPRVLRALTVAYHVVRPELVSHVTEELLLLLPLPQAFFQVTLKTLELLNCRKMPGLEVCAPGSTKRSYNGPSTRRAPIWRWSQ